MFHVIEVTRTYCWGSLNDEPGANEPNILNDVPGNGEPFATVENGYSCQLSTTVL